ncbi:MAG: 6-bladed beta-propeller [Candidatus Aminicenantes bacterium]|nr:6-bladed beta-propeller [Candidatus Aminicenantes bacterium]
MSKTYTRREFLKNSLYGAGAIALGMNSCSRNTDYKVGREIVDGVESISNPREPFYGESGSLEKVFHLGVETVAKGDEDNPSFFAGIKRGFVKDDLIYAVDSLNSQVRIFDVNGNHRSTFGRKGEGPSEFNRPFEIYVDDNRFTYVQDNTQKMSIKVFDDKNVYRSQHKIREMFGSLDIFGFVALNPEDLILQVYRYPKIPLEERKFFARTTNPGEFFGPFREYKGLRKSLDRLARDGRPASDYGFFFTRGSLFLDESESGQALYSSRRAFPSEIIIQSLDADPFRIIKREPSEGGLIKYLDVSRDDPNRRDIRDMTDANVVEAKVPEGITRRFYFSERGLGIHNNEENIFAVWRKLVDGEKPRHYVDIYDKGEGKYLYRVPFDIDLGNFLGMDGDNNLYFGFDTPYPHIAGYSINLEK